MINKFTFVKLAIILIFILLSLFGNSNATIIIPTINKLLQGLSSLTIPQKGSNKWLDLSSDLKTDQLLAVLQLFNNDGEYINPIEQENNIELTKELFELKKQKSNEDNSNEGDDVINMKPAVIDEKTDSAFSNISYYGHNQNIYKISNENNVNTDTNKNTDNKNDDKKNPIFDASSFSDHNQHPYDDLSEPVFEEKRPDHGQMFIKPDFFEGKNENYYMNSNQNNVNQQINQQKPLYNALNLYGSNRYPADIHPEAGFFQEKPNKNLLLIKPNFFEDNKENSYTNSNQNNVNQHINQQKPLYNALNLYGSNRYPADIHPEAGLFQEKPNKNLLLIKPNFFEDNKENSYTNSNQNNVNQQINQQKPSYDILIHSDNRYPYDVNEEPDIYKEIFQQNPIGRTQNFFGGYKGNSYTNSNQNSINEPNEKRNPFFNTSNIYDKKQYPNNVQPEQSFYEHQPKENPIYIPPHLYEGNSKKSYTNSNQNNVNKQRVEQKPVYNAINLYGDNQFPYGMHLKPLLNEQQFHQNPILTEPNFFGSNKENSYTNSNQNIIDKQKRNNFYDTSNYIDKNYNDLLKIEVFQEPSQYQFLTSPNYAADVHQLPNSNPTNIKPSNYFKNEKTNFFGNPYEKDINNLSDDELFWLLSRCESPEKMETKKIASNTNKQTNYYKNQQPLLAEIQAETILK